MWQMLIGYSEVKEGEWRRTVRESVDGMTDPYSRALFAFLAANEGDLTFASVLDEDGVYMSDKVAFAAQYLSDERLTALVNNYWHEYRDRGDLVLTNQTCLLTFCYLRYFLYRRLV